MRFLLWRFRLPGILKGWADRDFVMGRICGGERFYEKGVFKGKRALLSVTTGGPKAVYQKGGWNGDIHAILQPIQQERPNWVTGCSGLRSAMNWNGRWSCAERAGGGRYDQSRACGETT
jgi:hypothetical protein